MQGVRAIVPVLGSALLACVLAACGGGADGAPASTGPSCPVVVPKPSRAVAANTIYLNIINASQTSGLAAKTSVQLGWRGYHVLDVENQSVLDDSQPPTSAEIRYGKSSRQIALTLATQVKNPVLVEIDRNDPTVDLVLGDKFALVPVPPPPPAQVEVNVYNTTFRSGLSGQVADQLSGRGFKIKSNGNDPSKSFLPDDTALIRHGERGEPQARRAQLQIKGSRLVKDGREGTDVDVVLGNGYAQLVPEAQATPAPPATPSRPAGC